MPQETFADVFREHPLLGRPLAELPTPAPLVDLDLLEANIATMADFFRPLPAALRPHAKTHRAPAIARLQIAAGATGITCAKVGMAEAMADGGISDLYIANQVVAREAIMRLCRLAERATVTVAVDAASNVTDLSAAAQAHGVTLNVVIEIDAGMGRCGVQPGQPALDLARLIIGAPGLHFAGLHAYEGHVVQNPDLELRTTATEAMLAQTIETRDLLIRHGIEVQTVTCGGTGTYAISGVYPGVTEHQAGSYVYMDPGYNRLIPAFQLAFSFLCTVISRPTADKVITDGGGQSLANDYGTPFVKDHPELAWRYHSEEHGSFSTIDGGHAELALGEQLQVYPGHCCSAANLHDQVFAIRNGHVEAVWAATARGRSQ
ncbi:MAG TPA: DSD1 family PLP-dependent enzyme [Thermomicrobiales bacterium]|jgi:D-serine deaminase-like pyridoxal phosphate-dependent protein